MRGCTCLVVAVAPQSNPDVASKGRPSPMEGLEGCFSWLVPQLCGRAEGNVKLLDSHSVVQAAVVPG